MAPGTSSKFRAPKFEPEVFRKPNVAYCIEVLVTLLGLLGPRSHSGDLIVIRRPGNVAPCPPVITP